jgi:hypothetical protein
MTHEEELQEVIHEVEEIEHQLDERMKVLEWDLDLQRHLPGDLSSVFEVEPPAYSLPSPAAPRERVTAD